MDVLYLLDDPADFYYAEEDEDIESRIAEVENIGIPRVIDFCIDHDFTPPAEYSPIANKLGRYYYDRVFFFWDEVVLNEWVRTVFYANVVNALTDKGYSEDIISFFAGEFWPDISNDMDSDTVFDDRVLEYYWPSGVDMGLISILNKAHDNAYNEVFKLADKGLDLLEKTCGNLRRGESR